MSQSNKRRVRRRPSRSTTKVICYRNAVGLGPNIAKGISDISEEGARLLLTEELPVGQVVQLVLEAPGFRTEKIEGAVVWIVPEPAAGFRAGVRFEKTLNWAGVQRLGRV